MKDTLCKRCLQDVASTSFYSCEDVNSEDCFFVCLGKEKAEEIEHCVICGVETPYKRSTHIDFRNYYVEGSGQLCKDCYQK